MAACGPKALLFGTLCLREHAGLQHGALQGEQLVSGARAKDDAIGTSCRLWRPEHSRLIEVGIAIGEVGGLFLDEHGAPGQQLHQPGDDPAQRRLQLFIGRRGRFHGDWLAVRAPPPSSPPRPWPRRSPDSDLTP
jgi:hypothetical protein